MPFPFRFQRGDVDDDAAARVGALARQTTSTLRGMRKYSMVRASAKELGGITQQSPLKSTKLLESKFFGSTMVLLML